MLNAQGVEAIATPGGSGQFDILRDGELVFSKRTEGRFPGEGEVERLVSAR